jgi:menaquinone-dependent protoporphyrinogen IX oxidase
MNRIVVYGSRFGNTRKVAESIAGVLRERGDVRLLPAEERVRAWAATVAEAAEPAMAGSVSR